MAKVTTVRQSPHGMLTYLVRLPFLTSCSNEPLHPWTADAAPLALVAIANAGIVDERGRFREIFCQVLESRAEEWPDYRPSEEALTQVANEPPGTGKPVNLGSSRRPLLALSVDLRNKKTKA